MKMDAETLNSNNSFSVKKSVRSLLRGLEVGASCSFPISRVASIRSMTWLTGLELDRVFKTRIDKPSKRVIVIRQS